MSLANWLRAHQQDGWLLFWAGLALYLGVVVVFFDWFIERNVRRKP